MTEPLRIERLGRRSYAEVWELQKAAQQALIGNQGPETLFVCEHPAVLTLGRSGSAKNLLCSREELSLRGVEFFEVERGGDITYHGPGQIVAYPIMDLRKRTRDVNWYMRRLEEVIIETLKHFNIKGLRITGKTGIWTQVAENVIDSAVLAAPQRSRKIASLGVRISRWCTLHGFALNVKDCSQGFSLINPCGFSDIDMSCMEQEAQRPFTVDEVAEIMIATFVRLFPTPSSLGADLEF